jgi:hypothetical protein
MRILLIRRGVIISSTMQWRDIEKGIVGTHWSWILVRVEARHYIQLGIPRSWFCRWSSRQR